MKCGTDDATGSATAAQLSSVSCAATAKVCCISLLAVCFFVCVYLWKLEGCVGKYYIRLVAITFHSVALKRWMFANDGLQAIYCRHVMMLPC